MNKNRNNDKSNTGSVDNSYIVAKQIINSGLFLHKGKTVVTGDQTTLTDIGDVVGPKVAGDSLQFYYIDSAGDARVVIITGDII